jgi:DNA-binding CsgD family transcriptional regulator
MYTNSRLERAIRIVDQLADLEDPAGFPGVVLPGLAGLIGCDVITYNEIGGPGQPVRYDDYPPGSLDPESRLVFTRLVSQHPAVRYFRKTGDGRAAKISDFFDRRHFHATALYADFFGLIPVEYQIAITINDSRRAVIGIALNRARLDFSESDRDLLTVLRPPLVAGLRRAHRRCRARAVLGSPAPPGLAVLTDREAQVLEKAALGRTNGAIGHALGISTRTVAKHLENAYGKLGAGNRASAVAAFTGTGTPPPAPMPGGAGRAQ